MAGVVPVIRVLEESLAGTHVERVHGIVNGTTNFVLSEMERGLSYARGARRSTAQGLRRGGPTDDVTGRDAAAKMAILARLAFGAAVRLDQVPTKASNTSRATTSSTPASRAEPEADRTAERTREGISVRVHPAFLYPGHPLASVAGSFNAVTVESDAITEVTMSGPGAGGLQTASAVLGDIVGAMLGGAAGHRAPVEACELRRRRPELLLRPHGRRRPAGCPCGRHTSPRRHGVSIKSVVQRGMGEQCAPGDGHPSRSSSRACGRPWSRSPSSSSCALPPRTIRVIEEEFVMSQGERR